jgi:hypothetical protein
MYWITTSSSQGDAAFLQIIMLMTNNKNVLCQSLQGDTTPGILLHKVCTQSRRVEFDPLHNLADGSPGPGAMAQSTTCICSCWEGGGRSWNAVTRCSVSKPEKKYNRRRRRCSSGQCFVDRVASLRYSFFYFSARNLGSWPAIMQCIPIQFYGFKTRKIITTRGCGAKLGRI